MTRLLAPRRKATMRRLLPLALTAVLACGACGQTEPDAPGGAAPEPTATASDPEPEPQPAPEPTPGAPMVIPFSDGARLAVVGVPYVGVLEVREGPGEGFDVVATLPPEGETVTTGRGWSPRWIEVTVGETTGWAELPSLAGRDGTFDVTAEVIRRLGERPQVRSLRRLGRIVAEARASMDPPSSITMTVPPQGGDAVEVVFDVVGLGDDSVWAERLRVFAHDRTRQGFSLRSVESTFFCARGASTGGLCP